MLNVDIHELNSSQSWTNADTMVTCAILSVVKSHSIQRGISAWDLWGQWHEGTEDTERRALGANPVVSGRTAGVASDQFGRDKQFLMYPVEVRGADFRRSIRHQSAVPVIDRSWAAR